MDATSPTVTVSPRMGVLLTELAETPDLDTALRKVLSEYVDLKLESLRERVRAFEARWGMAFEAFSERCEAGTLDKDPYSYDVERTFWEWEKVVTLLRHYEDLRAQWM